LLLAEYQAHHELWSELAHNVAHSLSIVASDWYRKLVDVTAHVKNNQLGLLTQLARQNQALSALANNSIVQMEGLRETIFASRSPASFRPSPETREFKIPFPANPVHETNRQLGQLIGTMKDFRAAADDWTQTVAR
jgi:hypothetical protein